MALKCERYLQEVTHLVPTSGSRQYEVPSRGAQKRLHCLRAGKASSAPRDTANDKTMRDTSALASLVLRHNNEHDGVSAVSGRRLLPISQLFFRLPPPIVDLIKFSCTPEEVELFSHHGEASVLRQVQCATADQVPCV